MRGAPQRGGAAALLLGWAAVLASCTFLVDDELGDVRCSDEGAFGPPACPEGQVCRGGLCASPTAAPLGAACRSDADCNLTDFCLDPALVGESGAMTCTRNCCSSSDCDELDADGAPQPARAICWVPAQGGGRFCRSASTFDRGPLGVGKGGAACGADADCRSGVCDSVRCADACCSDTSCDFTDATCSANAGIVSEGATWSCAAPAAATKGFLEACAGDAECQSGMCAKLADTLLCTRPCCDSASCGDFDAGGVVGALACVHVVHRGTLVPACGAVLPITAERPVGAPCTGDADCRGGRCEPETSVDGGAGGDSGYCSDACCIDADCGDPATFLCRPSPDAPHVARCERKP